jgi:hypothetical protein
MKLPPRAAHSEQRRPRTSRTRILALAAALWAGLFGARAASAAPAAWLADHIAFDISAIGGWRAAWADDRNPGYQILAGGGEVNLGLEFDNGFGFLLGGRVLFGPTVGPEGSNLYADATGQLMAQLRVADVRIALGASVGRLFRCCTSDVDTPQTSSVLAGGFVRLGFDWLSRNATLPRALGFWLRIGIDGHPDTGSDSLLPNTSMNLMIGWGLRL